MMDQPGPNSTDAPDEELVVRLEALANAIVASFNAMTHEFGAGQVAIIADLARSVEEATERGAVAGIADSVSSARDLSALLRDGPAREAVLRQLRAEAAAEAQRTTAAVAAENRAALAKVRDAAVLAVSSAVPRIAIPWLMIGILIMLTIAATCAVLDLRGWTGSSYNAGYAAGSRDRALRESAFYQGLDQVGKGIIDRHDMHLRPDARLYVP